MPRRPVPAEIDELPLFAAARRDALPAAEPRRAAVAGLPAELWPRLPAAARRHVEAVCAGMKLELRITRPRRTKLGDHRGPTAAVPRHRISINADLNPYAFLTTLLHELAHAATWERQRGIRRRVRPHGPEWKGEFKRILAPVVEAQILPEDVGEALGRLMRDPAAATCTDRGVALALARYDTPVPGVVLVESLPPGAVFRVEGGRVFRLGPRLRTRFRCTCERTGREYRMHPLCRVEPIPDRAAG
jgi:SprT protein